MPSGNDKLSDSIYCDSEDLRKKFYQLEFASQDQPKIEILEEIASCIPWNIPIASVTEEFADPVQRVLGRSLAPQIHELRVDMEMKKLVEESNVTDYSELCKAVFLLSSMVDEEASYAEFSDYLDRLFGRIDDLFVLNRKFLNDEVKIHLISKVLFQEEGFTGNEEEYDHPDNSALTRMVETKLGIPISLSVLYLLIAQKFSLPIYGINMPLHFLLHYESRDFQTFIDPFHGGVLIDKKTCVKFLRTNGYGNSERYFGKASTISIVKRMYRNLVHVSRKRQLNSLETKLSRQLSILEQKAFS